MTAPSQGAPAPVTNYIIPSSGSLQTVPFTGVFSATPYMIDWRQFSIDQMPFIPQGAFIDNSAGAGTLSITILGLGWTIDVPPGDKVQVQFPAPTQMQMSIVGDGQASIFFVNFPVLPSGQQVTVTGTVNVDVVSPNPLPVVPTVNATGVPYQVTEVPAPIAFFAGTIGTGLKILTLVPTPLTNLRKLIISIQSTCTQAAAGSNQLTVFLNGVQIYFEDIYMPAAVATPVTGTAYKIDLEFAKLGLPVGAAGTLVINLANNVTAGGLDVVSYFG